MPEISETEKVKLTHEGNTLMSPKKLGSLKDPMFSKGRGRNLSMYSYIYFDNTLATRGFVKGAGHGVHC